MNIAKKIFLNKNMSQIMTMFMSLFFIFVVAACGNSSSNKKGNRVVAPVLPLSVAAGCQGCLMNQGQIGFIATTDSNNGSKSFYLGLDLYGDVARANFNDPKIPLIYSGIVQAKGVLKVQYAETYLCNIMPGDYIVSTVTAGTWQGGIMSGLRLQAHSLQTGQLLLLTFIQGVINNPTSLNGVMRGEVNRLIGSIRIDSLNGQVCLGSTALPIELY